MTSEYERYTADAAVLAQIGRAAFEQPTRLRIRLPRVLADLAVAAWAREEADEAHPPGGESPEQSTARRRAGTLALIGLSIERAAGGIPTGDDVVVDLDAWHIGSALDAAEDAELLADPRQPDQESIGASRSGRPVHLYAVLRIDFSVSAAEQEELHPASSAPFQFNIVVKEVLPTAELASNEVRRLNTLNQDKRCVYLWQATRYYASGRKAERL